LAKSLEQFVPFYPDYRHLNALMIRWMCDLALNKESFLEAQGSSAFIAMHRRRHHSTTAGI
jgi:hypothetical protein